MEQLFRELTCVTCGGKAQKVRFDARLPPVEAADFSARRPGQHYHPRIVECEQCGQIYSSPYFTNDVITELYRKAGYISEPQLQNMTDDYVREFETAISGRKVEELRVLEVGCATGFFLDALHHRGYRHLQGVEPGREAVSLAPETIQPFIRNDFFGPDSFTPGSFDVVCCFQVMDHMPDPAAFTRATYDVLTDGGIFLTINHDIRAPITRLLGERSPMYDIEHIYLFDQSTIRKLFANAGFNVVKCRSLHNSYTLDYALKMFPLPKSTKRLVSAMLSRIGVAQRSLRVPGGNMVTVGQKVARS